MAKILIVDDELEIRDLLSRILCQLGHEVIEAADGVLAQDLVASQSFDLILTDVLMPRCSGLEFLKIIRSKGITVPAVAISGGGGTGGPAKALDEALAVGANAGVAKPFMPNDIVEAVSAFVTSPKTTSA